MTPPSAQLKELVSAIWKVRCSDLSLLNWKGLWHCYKQLTEKKSLLEKRSWPTERLTNTVNLQPVSRTCWFTGKLHMTMIKKTFIVSTDNENLTKHWRAPSSACSEIKSEKAWTASSQLPWCHVLWSTQHTITQHWPLSTQCPLWTLSFRSYWPTN